MIRMGMAVMLATAVAVPASAQQAGSFHWTGTLQAGQVVEIRGVNGSVRAEPADGSQIVVEATKHARKSNPASVHVEVVKSDAGVTICAVYPTPEHSRKQNACAAGSGYHMSTNNNDVSVDFVVKVPKGLRFTGRTVNGNVDARGLTADVNARTVNGNVDATDMTGNVSARTVSGGVHISTTGQADAKTVNGSIELSMGRADWTGDLSLETVNGSITLELPSNLSTKIDARTVNGSIQSDFPLTVTGRIRPRHITATIGQGGRTLDLRTVNGDIRLRKAS